MQEFNKEWAEKFFYNCKKISVIGNAHNAIESKIGKIIDSSDIVCRFNGFNTDGFEEYIGSKTDLYVTNLIYDPSPFIVNKDELKLVLISRPFSIKHYYNVALGEMMKNLKCLDGLEIVCISNEDFETLYKWLDIPLDDKSGKNPSSGLVLIYLLSKYLEDVEFVISGFEFFYGNKNLHYFDEKIVTEELKYYHEPNKEKEAFLRCLKGKNVFFADETYNTLFNE